MTNPQTSTVDDDGLTILDWLRVRTRYLVAGAAVVAVAGVGYWFYTRSAQIKSARAEQSLTQAKQAVFQGNAALAENDLQNLVRRYGNTRAGVEAGMVLAELRYGKGDYQKGVEALRDLVNKSGAEASLAKIHALIGDGQLQMGKPPEAAESYQRAADQARFDGERAFDLTRKAEALTAGGKVGEARRVWEQLANEPWAASVAAQARIRLGELDAQQARRS
jgi:predicted negative regulator of RcsB-dependent stress response